MYLYPLSFSEFLTVIGQQDLREHIKTFTVNPIIHEKILEYLKIYLWLGGMPEAVNTWIETNDPIICQRVQDEIIETYQQDFHKYAKDRQIPYIHKVFSGVPEQLGHKFKYVNIDTEIRSYLLKEAFELLIKAGIIYQCFHTSAQQQPLGASINIKRFKTFFFDVGLAQRLLGLDIRQWLLNPIRLNNSGAIAEQFVAQELMAYAPYNIKANLYYWHREAKSSNAEVDFITIKNGHIVPIEVKSKRKGRMNSMQLFLQSHAGSKYGLKISEGLFAKHDLYQEIPLYGIEAWLLNSSTVS